MAITIQQIIIIRSVTYIPTRSSFILPPENLQIFHSLYTLPEVMGILQ